MITGWARSNGAASPPTITVSWPFSAPAWPPDTGASRKSKPSAVAAACSSRAISAEAVVWSTNRVPFPIAGKCAIGAERHFAQVVVVADAGKDDVLALGGFARGGGRAPAILCDPFVRLGSGAVVDRHVVALGLEVAGHRIAHDAEAEKCCFDHTHLSSRSRHLYSCIPSQTEKGPASSRSLSRCLIVAHRARTPGSSPGGASRNVQKTGGAVGVSLPRSSTMAPTLSLPFS